MAGNHSFICDEALMRATVTGMRDKKRSAIQRFVKYIRNKQYFNRLFPQVKEQKPGKDLYSSITFWQFIICVYLIAFYTNIDARGT
jgi:hypothetical protein